ncbi:hypothetical protein STEG23_017525, partial [Scotinomys teguina]
MKLGQPIGTFQKHHGTGLLLPLDWLYAMSVPFALLRVCMCVVCASILCASICECFV